MNLNPSAERPNLLLIMTDQHRADYVGYARASKLATPNLDRLAKKSTVFERCTSVNPLCMPARTALLTGRYSRQIGTLSMSGDLNTDYPTFLQALQRVGYYTALSGKLHWFQGWPWGTPRGKGHNLVEMSDTIKTLGADDVWQVAGKQQTVKNYCHYAQYMEAHGLLESYCDFVQRAGKNESSAATESWSCEPFPWGKEHHFDYQTTEHALDFLSKRPTDKPFFLMASFCGPHPPYDALESYLKDEPFEVCDDFIVDEVALTEPQKQVQYKKRRHYRAMIRFIDDEIGRILDALEAQGVADNTVIMFTADHGELMGDHGLAQKSQPWHGSTRVPLLVFDPRKEGGQRVDSPVELTDVTATLLDFAGLCPQDALGRVWPSFNDRIPCRSLRPLLDNPQDSIRDYAYSECDGKWQMIESRGYKYIRYPLEHAGAGVKHAFFDLREDPDETRNVVESERYAQVLKEHMDYLAWINDWAQYAPCRWAPTR